MKLKILLRDFQQNYWIWILSICGIALGVAGWIAMRSSASLAMNSFEESVQKTVGNASHVIKSQTGSIDLVYYETLSTKHSFTMSPIRVNYARLKHDNNRLEGTLVRVVGIDPVTYFNFYNLSGDNSDNNFPLADFLTGKKVALAPSNFIQEGQITLGVDDREVNLHVADSLGGSSGLKTIYVDIGLSQKLFSEPGQIDRILIDASNSRLSDLHVPKPYLLSSSGTTSPSINSLLSAYRLNLNALALLSLFVGVFLVYNTMILYSHRQSSTLSLLRTLGLTSREILQITLQNLLVLGLIGSVLGGIVGLLVSVPLSDVVLSSVGSVLAPIFARGSSGLTGALLLGIVSGIAVTVLGGLDPIIRNWSVAPREWSQRGQQDSTEIGLSLGTFQFFLYLGIALIILAGLCVLLSSRSLIAGFIACFSISLAGSVLTILFLNSLNNFPVSGQWIKLACRNIGQNSIRSGIIIASLVAAFSMVFGVTNLVNSFQQSVMTWARGNIRADVYVSSVPGETTMADPVLKKSFRRKARNLSGINQLSFLRKKTVYNENGESLYLRGLSSEVLSSYKPITLNESLSNPFESFSGSGVFLSEPGSYRLDLKPGDRLQLPLKNGGSKTVRVAGIFNDYTPKYAIIYLNDNLMQTLYPNAKTRDMAVYYEGKPSTESLESLQKLVDQYGYHLQTQEELHQRVLKLFRKNFAITDFMKFLALLISLIGLTVTLISFNQSRTQFFGLLRASGADFIALSRMITYEGFILSSISFLGAIPTGFALSYILIEVINRRAFGWKIQMTTNLASVLELGGLVILATLFALIAPLWNVKNQKTSSLLQDTHQ
jgi:putative ABC transport system permease protein